MELTQALFILAIFIFAYDTIEDWLKKREINWTAAGLCLFAIAIYLA